MTARADGRAQDEMRSVELQMGAAPYAEGSCLAVFGNTRVLCAASVQDRVPPWLRNAGRGWVTAEYGMLPRATHTRGDREAARGKQSGRTQEIQRLIGRSLRACVDLEALGERQIVLDCDVLQADGGTRTASITGAWTALKAACDWLREEGVLETDPIVDQVAAISCGMVDGRACLDLMYEEDRDAGADANFVLAASGGVIEAQMTAEHRAVPEGDFLELMRLARKGCGELFGIQTAALSSAD